MCVLLIKNYQFGEEEKGNYNNLNLEDLNYKQM